MVQLQDRHPAPGGYVDGTNDDDVLRQYPAFSDAPTRVRVHGIDSTSLVKKTTTNISIPVLVFASGRGDWTWRKASTDLPMWYANL